MVTKHVPLNGTNYAIWKVQCKMPLIREDLWNIDNRLIGLVGRVFANRPRDRGSIPDRVIVKT